MDTESSIKMMKPEIKYECSVVKAERFGWNNCVGYWQPRYSHINSTFHGWSWTQKGAARRAVLLRKRYLNNWVIYQGEDEKMDPQDILDSKRIRRETKREVKKAKKDLALTVKELETS